MGIGNQLYTQCNFELGISMITTVPVVCIILCICRVVIITVGNVIILNTNKSHSKGNLTDECILA